MYIFIFCIQGHKVALAKYPYINMVINLAQHNSTQGQLINVKTTCALRKCRRQWHTKAEAANYIGLWQWTDCGSSTISKRHLHVASLVRWTFGHVAKPAERTAGPRGEHPDAADFPAGIAREGEAVGGKVHRAVAVEGVRQPPSDNGVAAA